MKGCENYMLFWSILTIIFLIIEISTAGAFFAMFFVLAAASMIFFERFFDNVYLELSIFSVISIILTFALRPLFIKYFGLNKVIENSNVDAFLEKDGKVVEDIVENGTGRIQVDYEKWTAKSFDGSFIPKDSLVQLVRIDGNVVFVKLKNN
jgi:membrane protein implicated in regulation of membrane protease activity